MPARSILFLIVALSFPSFAQIQPSVPNQPSLGPRIRSLEGKVLSKNGSPVPRAIVLLKDMKTLQVRSFVAQHDGKYHFYGLSSDIDYQVRAETDDMTSPTRTISVFDSRSKIVLNLKLTKKKKA